MWWVLIKEYWDIILFKRDPGNTPYSSLLLTFIVLLYWALILFQWLITDINQQLSFSDALWTSCSLILSYLVYIWVLLSIFKLKLRFVQTASCLLAGHLLVHLVASPLLVIAPLLVNISKDSIIISFIGLFYLLMTLVFAIWQFIISVYIFKQALMLSYLSATLAAFGLLAFNILTVSFG